MSNEATLEHIKTGSTPSISVENIDVIWSSRDFAETGKPVLSDISFSFKNYEKVSVIGRVGCGKSTLFNAIIKEAFVKKGKISITGTKLSASIAE